MMRKRFAILAVVIASAATAVMLSPRVSGQAPARAQAPAAALGQPSTKNGEWPMYTADLRGSKYSPLDQINASNFNKLEVAWRFKTDNLGPRPENKLEGTPLMATMTYCLPSTE